MSIDLREKNIEEQLSKIQSKLANAQEILLTASLEVENLYITLHEEKEHGEIKTEKQD